MKTVLCLAPIFVALASVSRGNIIVPGTNGSSGVLNVTENTTIDLSLAATGSWNGANSANGIYDAAKWAVVFNYSSVNIAAGATLTFTNHPSKAPVVWLVSGNVTIAGKLSVKGANWVYAPLLAEAGPGGFRGGVGSLISGPNGAAGFGPGGGFQQSSAGRSGSYGSAVSDSPAYGNPSLIPLIGGSGGAADPEYQGYGSNGSTTNGGGAGGGAIFIACAGTTDITGQIEANGGNGLTSGYNESSGGSGGGIRIVCDSLTGGGSLSSVGGTGWQSGGLGRIRIERVSNVGTVAIAPDPSVVPLTAGATALIWPPSTAPQVKVISIGGVNAPSDPRAAFGASGADVALPETATTSVLIETTNVEQASTVQVRLTPRSNGNAKVINAAVSSVVSTTPLVVRWTADVPVNTGYSAVQVRVVRP